MINTLEEAIQAYIKRGFGSMNKNDFEVFIFHKMLDGSLKNNLNLSGKSNYEISLALKIPETKVKRLRYEADLRYKSSLEDECRIAFWKAMELVHFRNDGEKLSFVMENVSVRKFLDFKLKQNGRFSDSSFNSEIVVLSKDDFIFLIETNLTTEEKKQILEKIKPKQTISEILKSTLNTLFKEIKEQAVSKIVSLSFDVIIKHIATMV